VQTQSNDIARKQIRNEVSGLFCNSVHILKNVITFSITAVH